MSSENVEVKFSKKVCSDSWVNVTWSDSETGLKKTVKKTQMLRSYYSQSRR